MPNDQSPDLKNIRTEYSNISLNKTSLPNNPLALFQQIWAQVMQADLHTPNACTLATANQKGTPSARIVLLRYFNEAGFTFFTNYQSRKAHDIEENPVAALLFFWPELETQIRVEGVVTKSSSALSNEYFASRPIESQVGAWASPQSQPIKNRAELELSVQKIKERFSFDNKELQQPLSRPEFWGGYTLQPSYFEFWKGRPNRLHDRIVYEQLSHTSPSHSEWVIQQLAP